MTEKPKRGRPKTLNADDLVDLAMRAYWAEGPARVSINAICQRAGVSKPSLYREFGNEDGLTCAALGSYAQIVLGQVIETLGGTDRFHDKIAAIARLVTDEPQHENGCLFIKMRAIRPDMGDQTQALIAQIDQAAIDAFAGALNQAVTRGEWGGAIPVPQAARYLHAQIGLALDMRARGEDPAGVLALALSVFGEPGGDV
jgi:AcrR family transcriptional regulator